MAEIGDDHHIGLLDALGRDPVDLLPLGRLERRVLHRIDFEQLVQVSEFDIAQLAGGRAALDAERRQRHVRADMGPDELPG